MTPIRSAKRSILKLKLVRVNRGLIIGCVSSVALALPVFAGTQHRPQAELPHAANFLAWLEVTDERQEPMRRIGFRAERSGTGEDSILYVIARRDAYDGGEGIETTWADGRTCPAIGEAMERLAALPTPDRNVPGIPLPRPSGFPPRVMDGNTYFISTYGETPDRHLTRMTLSGNSGPVAAWGQFVEDALEACWAEGLVR